MDEQYSVETAQNRPWIFKFFKNFLFIPERYYRMSRKKKRKKNEKNYNINNNKTVCTAVGVFFVTLSHRVYGDPMKNGHHTKIQQKKLWHGVT